MSVPRFEIQTLLDPAVYPWPVDEVRLIETHISWVLLAGDRVVKLKRPVDLGFVDFRDPAKRKQACEDEVRLNRRLTTDVYLDVVPITANGVDAPGEPLEWATLMRRMPADRMLDVLLREGTAPVDLAERLADRLIPFHLPSSPSPSSFQSPPSSQLPSSSPSLSSSQHPSSSRAKRRDLSLPEDPSSTLASSPTVILNEVKDLSSLESPETPPSIGKPRIHEQTAAQPRGEILHCVQNDRVGEPRTRVQPSEGTRGEILRVAQNDNEGAGGGPGAGLRATSGPSASVGMTDGSGLRATSGPSAALGMTESGTTTGCPSDPGTYLAVLTDNLNQVAEVAEDLLGREQFRLVDRSMRAFLATERDWLSERFQHWLVEGHGDLRCEHICLEPDAMQIYDCVEFEIAIRSSDVASDLAFLLMDLRRLDARSIADELLERYRAAGFDLPQPVIDLYAAHRALVRAKVAALERSGKDVARDLAHAFEAAVYLDLATAFATPISPLLVLVSGLSGSGKSTVAGSIGRMTGGTVFASDRVRKELAGLDAADSAGAEWHQGIYTGEWTARTYDRLLELAATELVRGHSAIVDATFLDNDQRERFVAAARAVGMPAAIVWTELDDAVARKRIEQRAQERNDPSDATFAIRERQQAQLRVTPLRIPEGAMAVTVDTSREGPASLDPFFATLQKQGLIGTLERAGVAGHA